MSWRMVFNLAVAAVYIVWGDQRSWLGVFFGLVIGFVLISVYDRVTGARSYVVRLVRFIRFFFYFLGVLVRANLEVAWEILTPNFNQSPRIVRYAVKHLTAGQTTIFANAITLTPGTLVVDVSNSGDTLYVHCMYAEDREGAIKSLRELDERLQEEVFS